MSDEGEGSEAGETEVALGGCPQGEAGVADEKLDVLQPKGVTVTVGVFARPEQEEKGQDDHVGSGLKRGRDKSGSGRDCDVSDQCDGDGFDTKGGRVGLFPRPVGALEAKIDVKRHVEAWVFGPH